MELAISKQPSRKSYASAALMMDGNDNTRQWCGCVAVYG
jgi:hypothetical protein